MILTNSLVSIRAWLETGHVHCDASIAPAQRSQYRQTGRLHPWRRPDLADHLCPEVRKSLVLASKQRGRAKGRQILRVKRLDHHGKHPVGANPRINTLEVLQGSDKQARGEQ